MTTQILTLNEMAVQMLNHAIPSESYSRGSGRYVFECCDSVILTVIATPTSRDCDGLPTDWNIASMVWSEQP